jgi:hypothetical protein
MHATPCLKKISLIVHSHVLAIVPREKNSKQQTCLQMNIYLHRRRVYASHIPVFVPNETRVVLVQRVKHVKIASGGQEGCAYAGHDVSSFH